MIELLIREREINSNYYPSSATAAWTDISYYNTLKAFLGVNRLMRERSTGLVVAMIVLRIYQGYSSCLSQYKQRM